MYNDDSAYAEVKEKYSLEAKLKSQKFSQKNYNCLLELKGEELTLEYFQRHGFTQPLVVRKNKDNGKLSFLVDCGLFIVQLFFCLPQC